MKLTKKVMLGSVLGTTALVAPFAFASERGSISQETKQELRTAVETNDYNQFVSIATDAGLEKLSSIDEEKFEAKVEKFTQKEAVRETVSAGNYAAFRTLVGDDRAENVNADNFYLLTNMQQARDADDAEAVVEARTALKDAGIKKPGKRGHKGERSGERPERTQR